MIKPLKINKMKKAILCLVCVLMFCSCDNSQKQAEIARNQAKQQAYDDSIKEVKRLAEIAEQKRIDSIAEYAWGDVKFGMSLIEVRNCEALKGCEIKRNSSSYDKKDIQYYCYLKDGLIPTIFFDFYKDRLYNVTLQVGANNKNYESLTKLITEKYGPSKKINSIPDETEYYNVIRSKRLLQEWFVGDKSIEMSIINKYFSDPKFGNIYLQCDISSNKEHVIIAQDELEEKEEEQKIKEEKQLQRENETRGMI